MANYFLYPEEQESLNSWLLEWNIELDHRTRNQFRDALPVARLVDRLHTNLVDLSVYKVSTSVAGMQDNWKMFKIRVLKSLKIDLSDMDVEQLALGTSGAIEQLLFCIKYTQHERL
ncbi:uncharacterized protein LOC117588708 [Drosophila guanche]|uniref:CH-like domain-containing protein n=1 Tax=Drosophila guanche TaxID=7266 RepID=A0A3B0KEQ8_DROGU|nr:uncharacterized protein LOC117588708 [Drosophila guanche]SPP86810.1 Hypothetical predicted protein [Drosophila guanche]